MPLFRGGPLPGLLPQGPLQQLAQVHRPPGTHPPGGQALPPLGPTHNLGPEASGPRAAWGWASVAWLPAWLSGSVTCKSSCLLSPLTVPFSSRFSRFSLPLTLFLSPLSGSHCSLVSASLSPYLSVSHNSVLPLSPAVTAVPSPLAGHEVTAAVGLEEGEEGRSSQTGGLQPEPRAAPLESTEGCIWDDRELGVFVSVYMCL